MSPNLTRPRPFFQNRGRRWILACTLATLWPWTTQAQVTDPHELLSQVDAYLGQPTFTDSFKNGDRFDLQMDECLGRQCDSVHSSAAVEVANEGGQPTAKIVYGRTPSATTVVATTHPAGNPSDVQSVTQSQWQSHHGNALRLYLEAMASYGNQIELLGTKQTTATVPINGTPQSVSALEIDLQAHSLIAKFTMQIFISKDLRGMMQFLRRDEVDAAPIAETKHTFVTQIQTQH